MCVYIYVCVCGMYAVEKIFEVGVHSSNQAYVERLLVVSR